jgi:hypothetical protein
LGGCRKSRAGWSCEEEEGCWTAVLVWEGWRWVGAQGWTCFVPAVEGWPCEEGARLTAVVVWEGW